MGNAVATDSIPVLVTLVDVHNPRAMDMFYFANLSTGGAATKVIGRSQTLSAEVSIQTILTITIYECAQPMFEPTAATSLGVLRVPVERLAERYSSGIFQQWFNLDVKSHPQTPPGDLSAVIGQFEEAYQNAVSSVYEPKVCLSIIGSAFEVQRSVRQPCAIFVGEDVKTQAGPDLKALIASHKQQAAYIDALHEALRFHNVPSHRPAPADAPPADVRFQAGPPIGGMGPPMMDPMGMGGPPMMGGPQSMPMGMGPPVMSNVAPLGTNAMSAPAF